MAGFIVRPAQEYLTQDQAAEYLNVPTRRLEGWRRLNKGPAYCKGPGGVIRYTKEHLDAYMGLFKVVVPRETAQAMEQAERVA